MNFFAWCVMPNHVHTLFEPIEQHGLADILHSWKSYSSKEINRAVGRKGQIWQAEYYDHLVRDEQEYDHCRDYVLMNPSKAGMMDWRWLGCSEARPSFLGPSAQGCHGRDARATRGS